MKKKAGIVAVTIVFVAIFVIRIIGVEVLLPEDDPEFDILLYESNDGRLNDHYISADTCREFFDRHKDSLKTIVGTVRKQRKEPWSLSNDIVFDNEGTLRVGYDLEYDETFVEALHEIYTDEIFRLNPYCIIYIWCSHDKPEGYTHVATKWYIDFRLFTRRASIGGMRYSEKPEGEISPNVEERLDDNWVWYCYGE